MKDDDESGNNEEVKKEEETEANIFIIGDNDGDDEDNFSIYVNLYYYLIFSSDFTLLFLHIIILHCYIAYVEKLMTMIINIIIARSDDDDRHYI